VTAVIVGIHIARAVTAVTAMSAVTALTRLARDLRTGGAWATVGAVIAMIVAVAGPLLSP
jgi:hypothetical protein